MRLIEETLLRAWNALKSFDFLCNPRFIVYMYFIMICMHCILLYMLMVDQIKTLFCILFCKIPAGET